MASTTPLPTLVTVAVVVLVVDAARAVAVAAVAVVAVVRVVVLAVAPAALALSSAADLAVVQSTPRTRPPSPRWAPKLGHYYRVAQSLLDVSCFLHGQTAS